MLEITIIKLTTSPPTMNQVVYAATPSPTINQLVNAATPPSTMNQLVNDCPKTVATEAPQMMKGDDVDCLMMEDSHRTVAGWPNLTVDVPTSSNVTEMRLTRNINRLSQSEAVELLDLHDNNNISNSNVSTPSSQSSISSVTVKQVEDDAWVQCEQPSCLKWRRIRKEEASRLGETEPWYCHMNTDTDRNTCDASEEDYRKFEQLMKKCRMKYKFSVLETGTLVWAKMSGYCRWPAIISPDPAQNVSHRLDLDGDPLSYHVEFLGQHHSHSWVHNRFVELYGGTELTPQITSSQMSFGGGGHHKKRGHSQTTVNHIKSVYRGQRVDCAADEANHWLRMKPQDRLMCIKFQYKPLNPLQAIKPLSAAQMPPPEFPVKKLASFLTTRRPNPAAVTHVKRRGRPLRNILIQPAVPVIRADQRLKPTVKKLKRKHTVEGKIKPLQMSMVNEHVKEPEEPDIANLQDLIYDLPHPSQWFNVDWTENQDIIVDTIIDKPFPPGMECPLSPLGGATSTILTSPKFCSNGQTLREKMGAKNSMMNRTKEEKFSMDVEMYVKNQETFDHDVRKFLKKHGCILRRLPVWNDVPVTLYQIFLAVFDRGGYHKACTNKQWAAIHRELSGRTSTSGSAAKYFYERYLYPYEMYQKKQEYKHLIRQSARYARARETCDTPRDNNNSIDPSLDDGFSSCSDLDDLQTMIEEMESLSNLIPDVTTVVGQTENTEGIKISFYSDSPPELSPGVIMADLTEFKGMKAPVMEPPVLIKQEKADNDQASQVDLFSVSSGSVQLVLDKLVTLEDIDKLLENLSDDDQSKSGPLSGEQIVPDINLEDLITISVHSNPNGLNRGDGSSKVRPESEVQVGSGLMIGVESRTGTEELITLNNVPLPTLSGANKTDDDMTCQTISAPLHVAPDKARCDLSSITDHMENTGHTQYGLSQKTITDLTAAQYQNSVSSNDVCVTGELGGIESTAALGTEVVENASHAKSSKQLHGDAMSDPPPIQIHLQGNATSDPSPITQKVGTVINNPSCTQESDPISLISALIPASASGQDHLPESVAAPGDAIDDYIYGTGTFQADLTTGTSQVDLIPAGTGSTQAELIPAGTGSAQVELIPAGTGSAQVELIPAGTGSAQAELIPAATGSPQAELIPAATGSAQSDITADSSPAALSALEGVVIPLPDNGFSLPDQHEVNLSQETISDSFSDVLLQLKSMEAEMCQVDIDLSFSEL